MELMIVGLAFGAAFVLAVGILSLVAPGGGRRRLARLGRDAEAVLPSSRESLVQGSGGSPLARALQTVGARSAGRAAGDLSLRTRLIHAGFRRPDSAAVYTGARVVLALALPLLLLSVPALFSLPQFQIVGLLWCGAIVGWVGPSVWLDRREKKRMRALERTLPDGLDLMVVCIEAGFGITASLARVAEEFRDTSPDLAAEFDLVVHETRAGKTVTEALRSLADRTGVSDVSALVALLVQTERFGTSVSDALRVHADAMRVRRMNRAEELAQQAPLKMIIPTSMIFAGLLVIFLLPAAAHFAQAFAR